MNNWYEALMKVGRMSGCHQMKERSFHIKGRQFPVCARCTGAFIGYLVGAPVYGFYSLPLIISLLFCAVMFADWLVQRLEVLESNNVRRAVTGFLCGFGLMHIYIDAIYFVIGLF